MIAAATLVLAGLGALPGLRAVESTAVDLGVGLEVLVVGISDYDAWEDLPGAAKDAAEVAEAAGRLGCGSGTSSQGGCRLTRLGASGRVTRRALVEAVAAWAERVRRLGPYGRGLFYYAGHGASEEDAGSSILVTSESERRRVSGLDVGKELDAAVRTMSHALVVVDRCYPRVDGEPPPPVPPRPRAAVAAPSRIFITSADAGQRADDESWFREALVEGLDGAADLDHDGYLTGLELGRYLRDSRLRGARARRQRPQTRVWPGSRGDFVIHLPSGPAARRLVPRPPARRERLPECRQGCPPMVEVWIPPGALVGPSSAERDRFPGAHGRCSSAAGPEPDHPCVHREFGGSRTSTTAFGLLVSPHEITFRQWDACYRAGFCEHWPDDHGFGRGDQPVVDVSFDDALRYVAFLRHRTGYRYRLPTSWEWELFARAGTESRRWWGDGLRDPDGRVMAVCRGCGSRFDGLRPAPVGSFPPNRYGVYEVLGNVWEWTCAGRDDACRFAPELRGGSFATAPRGVRSAVITWLPRAARRRNVGFRVVRDLTAAERARAGR